MRTKLRLDDDWSGAPPVRHQQNGSCVRQRACHAQVFGWRFNQPSPNLSQPPLRKSRKVIIMIIDIFHHCDRPRGLSGCWLSWVIISDVNTVWSSKTICVYNRRSKRVSNHRADFSLWGYPIHFLDLCFFAIQPQNMLSQYLSWTSCVGLSESLKFNVRSLLGAVL